MRIPLLSSKRVVQKITPVMVVKYVLPKRELVKIGVLVIGLEALMHAPVRRSLVDRVEAKIDQWVGTESDPERRTRN